MLGFTVGLAARMARGVSRAVGATFDAELLGECVSVLDPRPGRGHRRVADHGDRVHVEVRGLDGPDGARVGATVEKRLVDVDGATWCQVNAVLGRIAVGLEPGYGAAEVLEAVRSAEEDCGTDGLAWSRGTDLPGDREPLIAAGCAVAADLVGLAIALAAKASPVPAGARFLSAVVALCDAQPRVRRTLEGHFGAPRTDLVITLGGAVAQAVSHNGAALLVDACQRSCSLVEWSATRAAWLRWEPVLHGPGRVSVADPLRGEERPVPLPAGPIERFADQAAAGSLLGAGLAVLGRQGPTGAAQAVLVGVPKATRTSRESFAAVLSASLARQGALCLDSGVWRRLDRVDTLVVDGPALRTGPPVVLDAEALDEAWSKEHVWSAGQRLLWAGDGAAPPSTAGLPIPPPRGREGNRLHLGEDSGTPGWRDLDEDGRIVGRILVGRELDPRADDVLAAARRAGLRVVLADDAGTELRGRADECVPEHASLSGTVRRLQEAGHVVAAVSARGHRALAAADVGLGPVTADAQGLRHIPWSADVVCPDLTAVQQIVAATAQARAVSERGRTLAMSGSALAALLLVARPRGGLAGWHSAVGPITGTAMVGLVTGARAGRTAARPPAGPAIPLVPWHNLEADEVLARLPAPAAEPADRAGGVPARAAALARGVGGTPVLRVPLTSAASMTRYVREELADPLTPVLAVGAGASAILGAPTDAVLVGSVMGVNALVSALQRQRAERAMRALRLNERILARRLAGPGARVVGPAPEEVPDEVVPSEQLRAGDVIALCPGDVVPADARLLYADDLELDESGLTGESVTVDKQVAATPGADLPDRTCMVFEGSVVTAGRGRAVVVAVGPATQAGRAVAAVAAGTGPGGVQAQLRALTDKALPLTLGGGALVSGLGMLRGQGMRAAVADGVAVAVAAVPEGLPLVATVAQLAAARRLSRRGVLVRSSRTVEALGRVDTMCFDKTGTLTQGVLSLVELADLTTSWTPAEAEGSPRARRLLRAAARACPDPADGPVVHATDRAVLEAARAHLGRQAEHVWDPVEEVPFESNRGYAATLGHSRRTLRLVVKGAPEVLLPRCVGRLADADGGEPGRPADVLPLTAADREAALGVVHALAEKGLRVLLVARRELASTPPDIEAAVEDLTLLGFIGLADTPRASTGPVLAELAANGIGTRMITGDHPVTARAIAAQLGIPHEHVVTGAELDELDETGRTALINRSTVFARVSPEHKVRIVEALRRGGRVVAMAGDGSNDAAAIRLADVGIGIATQGSAAARNAADLVLTEPDLTLLLDALIEGRRMWLRVRDAVAVLVGGNAGEVAFTVLGTALTGRAPVGTRQFLLVNLLTDMFPAMAVALARPGAAFRIDDLAPGSGREHRAHQAGAELAALPTPELGGALLRSIAIRGTATAAGATGAWLIGRGTGTRRRAATMGLVALVGTQLGQTLLLGGRSPLVWITVAASGAVLIGVVQTPGLSRFFGCTPLDPVAYLVVVGTALTATAASAAAGWSRGTTRSRPIEP